MSAAPSLKTALKFKISIVKGPHAGAELQFDKATVTIGRGGDNDISLANDPRVSRQHAEIKNKGGEYYLVNLSQKNFILMDGQSVQSERLDGEHTIQIGESELKFSLNKPAPVLPNIPSFANSVPVQSQTSVPQNQPRAQAPMAPMPGLPPQMPPQQHHYQAAPAYVPPVASGESLLQNKRVRFYAIIAVVGVAAWFFLSSGAGKAKKDANSIRTSDQILMDLQNSEDSRKKFEERREKFSTIEATRAQENFVKAFRDYQQGQYARARESFQVVLNLDPENELAKRYLHLSKVKFDEVVKFSMIQGSRFREKKNWRKCQSSFSQVMTMLQSRKTDPTYQEAKKYYDECSLAGEGRY